jgi:serine/threonine-protein kinase ATR
MAAQLISNLSNATKPLQQTEQDDLKKLMDEVSSQEANILELTSPDEKLAHKHKLLYVFARAVLERLVTNDPFMDVQRLVPQASEALDIFMSTIKETPRVLSYVLKPNSVLRGRGQEPLFIWLFPRVLALLGREECESLTEKIKDFFYISFQVVASAPSLWDMRSLFFCYLKECVSSMCHQIGSSSLFFGNSSHCFQLS